MWRNAVHLWWMCECAFNCAHVALSTCGCITLWFHELLICTEGKCDRIELFVHFKPNGVFTSEETAISLCNFLVSSLLF